jgi:predicted metal-dependent enzyme (double-stranded beta helix superfamily)
MATISPGRPAELMQLVDAVANHPASWVNRLRFAAGERWWTRLHSDSVTEVWLLTWDQATATELHDHGDSAGAFTVLTGQLEEVRVDLTSGNTVITQLGRGGVRSVDRGVVHDVRNASPATAISIHAYSPPLQAMTYYQQRLGSPPLPGLTVDSSSIGQLA